MDNWKTLKFRAENRITTAPVLFMQAGTILKSGIKNAFMPLARIRLNWIEMFDEIVWPKYLKREGGRENALSEGVRCLMRSIGIETFEKRRICLEYRLPAGSACETNIENKYIYPISTGINFASRMKTLPSSPEKSIFVMKLYFNYPHWSDPYRYAETTIYSMDLPEEREEAPGERKRKITEYNGYRYLVFFCFKVYRNKELLYAKIYSNQIPTEKHLDHLNEDNICLRVRQLNEKKT